jgi:hypothetical protein
MILPRYFTRGITGLEMNFVAKKELFVSSFVIILNIWEGRHWIDLVERTKWIQLPRF